jgi:hypothetical protein
MIGSTPKLSYYQAVLGLPICRQTPECPGHVALLKSEIGRRRP